MQRLVYSPKIQAFINTQTGVLDITDFIVSGTVQRVVNEVSTAELVIRNPGKRFTDPGNPTFRPMDGITIFGSRHKGRPVQMFTGYLDQSPYMQLFPGTCTLRASCTLKRLMYTYMDGGLPYTWDFLRKYGWLAQPETGGMKSPAGDQQTTQNADGKFTDGSVGDLMFGVLKDIGQWDEEQILIESFPKDASEIVQGLNENIASNVSEAQKQFDQFLTDIIGEYSPGSGLPVGPGGGQPTGDGPKSGSVVTPKEVGIEMINAGFPKDPQVIANGIETMQGESGFGDVPGWDTEHDAGVLGYWQIQLSTHPDVSADCAMNLRCSTKAAYEIWKAAGGCFACQPGPNPWQGGTDHGTQYLNLAKQIVKQYG